MSLSLMNRVWQMHLPCTVKMVLMSLADQANDYKEWSCFPGLESTAKRAGLDVRSVRRILRQLEVDGHITTKSRPGRASLYFIHPNDGAADAGRPAVLPTPDNLSGVPAPLDPGHSDRGGGQSVRGGGHSVPLTLKEHTKETQSESVTPSDILEGWNVVAKAHDLPIARRLTDTRLAAAKARIKDYPDPEDWRLALRNLRASPFLLGEGPRGWKADIDFFLRQSSFTRLLEGSYGQNS